MKAATKINKPEKVLNEQLADRKAALEAIDSRAEWRKTECYQNYDYLLETVSVHRPDTGDVVNVRDMTRDEIQKKLFA